MYYLCSEKKALISFAVTAKLICVFVFAYEERWFSHDAAHIHFEHMVHRIYPAELQLNKANASDTEAAFLDLNLSIHNVIVSTKIYDKRDDC